MKVPDIKAEMVYDQINTLGFYQLKKIQVGPGSEATNFCDVDILLIGAAEWDQE